MKKIWLKSLVKLKMRTCLHWKGMQMMMLQEWKKWIKFYLTVFNHSKLPLSISPLKILRQLRNVIGFYCLVGIRFMGTLLINVY